MRDSCLALVLTLASLPVLAQSAQPMAHAPASASTSLTITGPGGKVLKLSPEDLKAMPHKTAEVFNEHAKAKESYSGVPLSDLLKQVDAPTGEKLRGKLYLLGVIAEGADHYRVLYSLAETDPANHTGDVLIADQVDGKPIDKDGAFKLISTEEKRPARWVRNLTAITVKPVE
ncbi:molybdopterin-binding protein [Terriglobus tenax]|uniref:molybdopterin-dependent oxidoreductase n=1 Tax=Terriglobus tenax TaxID=1111115 RepID=UPI0021E03129|nr:molybdopterin-dependent oxidoreductase [Terriglobus tenax]